MDWTGMYSLPVRNPTNEHATQAINVMLQKDEVGLQWSCTMERYLYAVITQGNLQNDQVRNWGNNSSLCGL